MFCKLIIYCTKFVLYSLRGKMKYLIDLTSLSKQNTGIEYVAEHASLSFVNICPNDEFVLVFNGYVPSNFKQIEKNINVQLIDLKTKNFDILRLYKLPKFIRQQKADYNLFFAFPCPYFAPHKNSVTLIHDLTPYKYAYTQKWTQSFRWRRMIKKCIKKDKHILTVSDTVKYEIANKFSRGDAKRIYPGIKNPTIKGNSSILKENNISVNKYILSVGTFEKRKNYQFLIDAFLEMKDIQSFGYKLVLVGKKGWKLQRLPQSKHIVYLDFQNEKNLNTLYSNAALFISASVYEGFGLPVIEAVKHNTKILISDIPVYRETTSNLAMYFDCNNKEDLHIKIIEALNKNEKLNISTEKFNWENYALDLRKYLCTHNKYLSVCTRKMDLNCGAKIRIMQYYDGLEHFHYVDKYVGNSHVRYSVLMYRDILNAVFKRQCTLKTKDYFRIKKLLKSGKYSTVFLDNSLFGPLYKRLKKKFPKIKLITHFHNCEFKYFSDMYTYYGKTFYNVMSKLTLHMIKNSEAHAVQYSDNMVFISSEDKQQLAPFNCNTTIVPICYLDLYKKIKHKYFDFDYVMFVGSDFYANVEALNFICKKIAPYVDKKIVIVSDSLKKKYKNKDNVCFVSYTGNIEHVFSGASAFVAPVFSGSGSKVKIAEALMWGKKIIATKFSLAGYDWPNADVDICSSDKDFINAINKCNPNEIFSQKNRNLYLQKYSPQANIEYFKDI